MTTGARTDVKSSWMDDADDIAVRSDAAGRCFSGIRMPLRAHYQRRVRTIAGVTILSFRGW